MLSWQVTMDQLICASLSHTHYWYEMNMLKAPALYVCMYVCTVLCIYVALCIYVRIGYYHARLLRRQGFQRHSFHGVGPGCRQGAASEQVRCMCALVGRAFPGARLRIFPACVFVPGTYLWTTIVPTCSPQYYLLFASRACDTVETGLV